MAHLKKIYISILVSCMGLSLASCSSTQSGSATASSSTSASASAHPNLVDESAKPTPPPSIYDTTGKGALDTFEYFLRLNLYALATNDWEEFEALRDSGCVFCNEQKEEGMASYAEGDRIGMADIHIIDSSVTPQLGNDGKTYTRVIFLLDRDPAPAVDKNGTYVENKDGQSLTMVGYLYYNGTRWHVSAVDVNFAEDFYTYYHPERAQQ